MTTISTVATIGPNEKSAVAPVQTAAQAAEPRDSGYLQAYHEMAERHHSEADVLVQLRANIAQLEDLHGRLKFMMGEIAYLLKRG